MTRQLLMVWIVRVACGLACSAVTRPAQADPGLHAYALVIGSNRGGEGQGALTYAERDAERMAELLRELGRTPRENIELLAEPRASDVEQALERLRYKLQAHADAGERAQLLFYYSGHARAHALSLGAEELSLASLRKSLLSLPSTLTVVVLDACQSGAFSGVKGAAQTADFSISSVQDLNSTGIAVMASSTGTELSQESSTLGSSYFTHHLLTSLRGAGDLDRNGRVSLDEAYRYAYQHTLSDTARTQVGSQHATLETELTGRGDVPLSYPVDADAQLALPGSVSGRVMVQIANGPVVAELVKAKGGSLLIALPSGSYDVLLRSETGALSCAVPLTKGMVHTLSTAACMSIDLPREVPKTAEPQRVEPKPPEPSRESWFLELGFSLNINDNFSAYEATLERFGYEYYDGSHFGVDVALGYMLSKHFGLVARFDKLETGSWERYASGGDNQATFGWKTYSMTAGLRTRWPIARHWLVAFAEVDAGLAFSRSVLENKAFYESGDGWYIRDHHLYDQSYALRGLAGFDVGFTRHFGIYLAAGYTHANSLVNELGERQQSGGITVVSGLRLNGVKGWW